jgi:hypothetical protein
MSQYLTRNEDALRWCHDAQALDRGHYLRGDSPDPKQRAPLLAYATGGRAASLCAVTPEDVRGSTGSACLGQGIDFEQPGDLAESPHVNWKDLSRYPRYVAADDGRMRAAVEPL